MLSSDYMDHGDASAGPLKPGDVGTLSVRDGMYVVRGWNYFRDSLKRIRPPSSAQEKIVHLRSDLASIKTERERVRVDLLVLMIFIPFFFFGFSVSLHQVQAELSSFGLEGGGAVPGGPSPMARQMSASSEEAALELKRVVTPADGQRGRHLLRLARAWGDTPDAVAARASVRKVSS
jgi:hypothetical protein